VHSDGYSRRKGRIILFVATADPLLFDGWPFYKKVNGSIVAAGACVKTKCSNFNRVLSLPIL
jgi:hypothetical protein